MLLRSPSLPAELRVVEVEADRQPVPAVDDIDHHGQLDLLLLAELLVQLRIDVGWSPLFRDQRQMIDPGQCGPLTGGENRRFMPGREQMQPLFGLACLARVGCVHVEAVGAAVDLRRADFDQLDQAVLELSCDFVGEFEKLLHQRWCGGESVKTGFHHGSFHCLYEPMTSQPPRM